MLDAWFYIKAVDVCVCMPAKCGGTSFYISAFGLEQMDIRHVRSAAVQAASTTGQGPFTPVQVAEYFSDKRKYLGVRDPVDRFVSLWRDKCRDGDPNMPMLSGWAPETLIQHIGQFPAGNGHWMPQYLYGVPGCTIIPATEILPTIGLEDRQVNKTAKTVNDPEMPREAVIRHYQQDFQMWRAVTC